MLLLFLCRRGLKNLSTPSWPQTSMTLRKSFGRFHFFHATIYQEEELLFWRDRVRSQVLIRAYMICARGTVIYTTHRDIIGHRPVNK
jgi:hypothetical protein